MISTVMILSQSPRVFHRVRADASGHRIVRGPESNPDSKS
jgi:hypothetical protein